VLISVVIPTLGRASLRTAIKSAIEQSIPVSEILVINDSGTMLDGLHEPRVRIIDTPGGLGAAGARQMGVTASGGEFVALLDDDDEWLDGHLENALKVLTAQREVAVYAARVELMTDGTRSSISPRVVYRGHISLISFLYGWRAFLGRSRTMPTRVGDTLRWLLAGGWHEAGTQISYVTLPGVSENPHP
jgi:glycosyltransferase involved in cell wall biosynthesis